jgi:hypothetical protein
MKLRTEKRKTKKKYAHELSVGDTVVHFNNVKGTAREGTIKEISPIDDWGIYTIIDNDGDKWCVVGMYTTVFVVK